MEVNKRTHHRISYIDSLRGLAILGVIATHVGSLIGYQGTLSNVILKAGYGVQLFFVISAFTIFLTLDNATRKKDDSITKSFFIKRLFRIAPVYWLGILLYSVIFGMNSRGWLPGPELWHYPMHFFFLNLLHPETPSSVVPGGWSISCEVLFYLICPLLFRFIKSMKSAFIFCLASILLGVFFILLSKITFLPVFIEYYGEKLAGQYVYRNIISQLGVFSFGILMFFLYRNEKVMKALSLKRINYFCLFVAIILMYIGISSIFRGASHYVMATSFVAIGLCLAGKRMVILDNRFLSFIGRISFSAYLIHFIAIHIAVYLFGANSGFISILISTLIITIPLSYLSFQLIEQSAVRLARKVIQSKVKTNLNLAY